MRFSKRTGAAAVLAAAAALTTAGPAAATDGTLAPQGLETGTAATAGVIGPQATLFTGTFSFRVDLQGRNMTTGTSRFCNSWRANAPERRSTTFFQIQLWRNVSAAPDVRIASSQGWNPQTSRSGTFCAGVPDTRGVYYFRYLKTNDTGLMTGSVTVSD